MIIPILIGPAATVELVEPPLGLAGDALELQAASSPAEATSAAMGTTARLRKPCDLALLGWLGAAMLLECRIM
ncbi:MAG: hypothetical protein ACYDBS_01350 [Acidimicrobiales bacterium]